MDLLILFYGYLVIAAFLFLGSQFVAGKNKVAISDHQVLLDFALSVLWFATIPALFAHNFGLAWGQRKVR